MHAFKPRSLYEFIDHPRGLRQIHCPRDLALHRGEPPDSGGCHRHDHGDSGDPPRHAQAA
jgi:hypothetical protein